MDDVNYSLVTARESFIGSLWRGQLYALHGYEECMRKFGSPEATAEANVMRAARLDLADEAHHMEAASLRKVGIAGVSSDTPLTRYDEALTYVAIARRRDGMDRVASAALERVRNAPNRHEHSALEALEAIWHYAFSLKLLIDAPAVLTKLRAAQTQRWPMDCSEQRVEDDICVMLANVCNMCEEPGPLPNDHPRQLGRLYAEQPEERVVVARATIESGMPLLARIRFLRDWYAPYHQPISVDSD